MAIIVEDGSVVTGANSYVSEAELTAYATARGITISGDTSQLLIKSMDYIEGLYFKGVKYSDDQPLQWPRVGVVVDGYLLDSDEIPTDLEQGQIETALSIDAGNDPLANLPRTKRRTKVGPLEVEYDVGQSSTIVLKLNNKLKKLLAGGTSGSSTFVVSRG